MKNCVKLNTLYYMFIQNCLRFFVLVCGLLFPFQELHAIENQDTVKDNLLDEVVVTAKLKAITKEGSITKVKVHGTPFSQMGSVNDMLGNIPGLFNNGNGIQVAGAGTPIYYLDGRELTEVSQLSILQASDIKDIRIERAPGPEFAAGTKAVIFITTYNPLHNNIYLNVNNTLGIRRKVSDYPGINLKAKAGKFVTALTYQFGTAGSEVRETYFRKIEHPTYVFESYQERKLPNRNIQNTVNWSGEYQINPANRLGLYYYFTTSHKKNKEYGTNIFTDAISSTSIDVLNKKRINSYLHSVSAVYDYNKNGTSIHLSQDFAYTRSNSKSNISETMENEEDLTVNGNKSTYRVATTNFRYNFTLPWKIGVSAGAKFSYVKSSSFLETTEENPFKWLNNSNLKVEEYTPQAYVALGRMFGTFLISPGLRYEYTNRKIVSHDLLNMEDNRYAYRMSSFYPFLTIRYNGKMLDAYIQYSRRVIHPDFNILNSGISYVDTLTYSLGAPDLKATTINDIQGGVNIGDFSLDLRYTHKRNPFENVEWLMSQAENIVYSGWVNFPRYKQFTTSLSYGSSWDKLNYYGEIDCNFHSYKLVSEVNNNFSIDFNANLTYQFCSRFSAYLNYRLQGRRTELATTQHSLQNMNLGFTGKFIKNRLSINIELMDILGKANYNNLSTTYLNVTNGTKGKSDMQGIRLRISYTIFNKTIKVKGSRENTEILNRIK